MTDEDRVAASVVRVKVVVYENGEEIDATSIGYYPGQDYTVEIVTPDGTDARLTLKAGVA